MITLMVEHPILKLSRENPTKNDTEQILMFLHIFVNCSQCCNIFFEIYTSLQKDAINI